MAASRLRRVGRGLRLVVVLMLVAVAARILWCGYGPHDPDVGAQVRFLDAAVDDGAGESMQQLFPEGEYFLLVLSGLAAPADEELTTEQQVAVMTERLERIGQAEVSAPFAGSAGTEHGAFYHGWTLLLEVERARLSGEQPHRQRVRAQAERLADALAAAPSGYLESYAGQTWPVDNVVAAAALARADDLLGLPEVGRTVAAWPERVAATRDPGTGLLPHRVDGQGQTLDGPRATSQSLIQLFWPEIDPASAPEQWQRFVDTFVDRRAGLVGVREHPKGVDRGGDVDSGPLVLGVSLSATVVTLGAARAHGDLALAEGLSREGELLGLPVQLAGQRRYAGGVLPVGDAFLAWARTVPAAEPEVDSGAPAPSWWAWALLPLGLAAVIQVAPRVSRRGTVRSP